MVCFLGLFFIQYCVIIKRQVDMKLLSTKKLNPIKKFICLAVACFMVFGITATPTKIIVNAYSVKSDITNNSFSSSANSEPNFSQGWQYSSEKNDDVISKIVSTEQGIDPSSTNYFDFTANGITNPGTSGTTTDKNVLMLMFKPQEGSSVSSVSFGIKTSSTTTLSSNSYYKLTVYAKAQGDVSFSFGLSNALDVEYLIETTNAENNDKLSNGDNGWVLYELYIITSTSAASACNIELWLGSRINSEKQSTGVVFFDEITLTKIDRASFEYYSEQSVSKNTAKIHSERKISSGATETGSFVSTDGQTNWTINKTDGEDENQTVEVVEYSFEIVAASDNDSGIFQNKDVLKVTNNSSSQEQTEDESETDEDATSKKLSITSKSFLLQQYGIYRISVFAKAETTTAELEFKLETISGGNKTQTSSLASSTTNSTYNDWTEYIFYVRATYISNTTATLTIIVGEESTVLLNNFTVEKINYSAFSSGTYKIDNMPSIDKGITNGFFEQVNDTTELDELKTNHAPLLAYSWNELGNKEDSATMGIISIKDSADNGFTFGNFIDSLNGATNPGYIEVNGQDMALYNAYVISSTIETYAGIESSTITAKKSNSAYIVLTVYVQTQLNAEASISLYSGDTQIANFENINTSNNWQSYNIYISLDSDLSLTLQLSIGSENKKSSGAVFFAAATCTTITETTYNQAKQNNESTSAFVNQNSFFAHTGIKNNGVYTPLDFDIETDDTLTDSIGGILDFEHIDSDSIFDQYKDQLVNKDGSKIGEYLALYLADAGAISATHTAGVTNTTTGYIQISFSVKTINLNGNLIVSLGDLEKFIISSQMSTEENNGWTTYSLIVKTGSNTIGTFKTSLTLGTETEKASGLILVDEITTTSVTEDEYLAATSGTTNYLKTIDISSTENSSSNKSNPGLKNNPTAIFFIVLSSLILVGVVIFVVVAKAVKKLPKRTIPNLPEPTKKQKNNKNDKGFV